MPRCAFLTTDDLTGHVTDDHLAVGHLRDRGWLVEFCSWRDPGTDWSIFDAVIIRSPWDYQDEPQAFLQVLQRIEDSGTILANPLSLVRTNIRKTYLRELENSGVPVVPTVWSSDLKSGALQGFFQNLCCDELVIKPVIGASAGDTHRLSRKSLSALEPEMLRLFGEREFMVQPFLHSVIEDGERSLFYFNGVLSHAVMKSPAPGDFRVQEEHGGLIVPVAAPDECVTLSERILARIECTPLYARIDLVRADSGEFLLMELELIEPALYFRMDPLSPVRFAQAFLSWIGNRRRNGHAHEQLAGGHPLVSEGS